MQPINPTIPLAPYVGGKSKLAKQIINRINQINHKVYAEPFVGMGGVFLRRNRKPPVEVINDYSRDVSNFFRIVQRHHDAFLEMIKWQLTSRSEFNRLLQMPPDTLTDLERAARFLFLQKACFGGQPADRVFGVSKDRPSRFDTSKITPLLRDVHTRLSSVTIECLPYADFITRYDSKDILFYCDPPYYKCEDYYGKGLFERADFERLADQLAGIKGRFILSLNDHDEIRQIFKQFDLEEVTIKYSISSADRSKNFGELLISN